MIDEIIFMKGYGSYVWSAFSFTLISFVTLYALIKINLVKEQNKFTAKFGLLNDEEACELSLLLYLYFQNKLVIQFLH